MHCCRNDGCNEDERLDHMKFDLHTHHDRCGHAVHSISSYIEAAIEAGLGIIGISDHSPYFFSEQDHPKPDTAMAVSEFPHYVAEVLRLKHAFADRIEVLLGVESDFYAEHLELYRSEYAKYPFDYIIGSVHYSGGMHIFDRARWRELTNADLIREKEEYYRLIRASARSGLFQIVGHIDAMKGYYPDFGSIPTSAAEETLKEIAANGVAIEVNTSGKTKDAGGWYPSDDLLERAKYYGIDVTFGSDAHSPGRVGDDFAQVCQRLKEIGFKEWVFFRGKKRQSVQL